VIGTAWSEASARSNAGERAAPRVNVRKKWAFPRREFQKNSSTPTFKKPIKPRPLSFELFAQSEPTQCSRVNFVHDVMERFTKIEENVAPFTQAIEYLQKVMDQEAVNHSGQDPRII